MSKQIISPQSTFSLPYLKPRLKKSSSQPKSSRDHQQTVRVFQQKLSSHRQQIDKNAMIIKMLTGQFEQIKHELARQRIQSEKYQNEKKLWEQKYTQNVEELINLKDQYRGLKVQYETEWNEHNTLKDKFANSGGLHQKVTDMEKSLDSLRKQIEQLAQENNYLKDKVRQEEEEKQKVADLVETYLNQMRNLRKINVDLVTHIENQQNEILIKEKQLIEVRQKTFRQAIDSKVLRMVHEKQHHTNEIQKLRQFISSLQQEKKQITSDYELKLKQKKKQYKDLVANHDAQLKGQVIKYQQQINVLKLKVDQLNNMLGYAQKLKDNEKRIKNLLSCTYCKQTLKQPVTCIPCGHSFCHNCQKGYQKQCFSCGPKTKIEAVYRNELLDEIVTLVKTFEQATSFLTSISSRSQS